MTKKEIITKWQGQANNWCKAKKDKSFSDKTKLMAENREKQLLYCIQDLKSLTK